jgi:hypothetical protein
VSIIVDKDYLPRWTRGQRPDWHVGMMAPTFIYLLAKFRQKEKLIFLIRKLNGFWRLSIARCKKNNNKKKSLIFLYLVFSVCGKQILEG